MCFSENASIISFSFGIIGALLCISLGSMVDKMVGYFFGYVSLMQGIEYLLWRHQKCDNYNIKISLIGMILNNLQPFVLGIIFLVFNPKNDYINKQWIFIVMMYYLCVIIPYSVQFIKNKQNQCTITSKRNKHLIWKWIIMNYYIFVYAIYLVSFCFIFLLGLPKLEYSINCIIVGLFTYITSAFFYPKKEFGSLWCFYIVFIPIIYYFIRINNLYRFIQPFLKRVYFE